MRCAAVAVAFLVAVASLPLGGTVAQAAPALTSRLDALVEGFPGGAAVWVADPARPEPIYQRQADTEVIAASLYKLALLAAVEREVDAGRLRYDDTITIDREDITDDGSFEAPGTELTIDDALEAMITISDNGTAIHFWRSLGGTAVNALLAKSGIPAFHVAEDEVEDNVVTARALGAFFAQLAKGQLVSKAASQRMVARLARQQINDRIPAQLPDGTMVAHKTGNLVGLVHDAGIVFSPRSQRVVVVLTWDTDDEVATQLIAGIGSAVYSEALSLPASARYRVPLDTQYIQQGALLTVDVGVENIGDDAWAASGAGRIGLVWELRDPANALLARSAQPLPLGLVPSGGAVRLPITIVAPSRPGDAKLIVGLADADGRALAPFGVATAAVPVRIHLPFIADATVRLPSLLHRREASLLEVSYTASEKMRSEDHQLSLGWRFIDPATDRVVAQGIQALGTMRADQRSGTFFAPLVAPNMRGTYLLEYELRERGFIAGVTRSTRVEVGAPRTFGDEAGPARRR